MMKFALVMLCSFVAVQARQISLADSTQTELTRYDNPWLVHMRIANDETGSLSTGQGTFIGREWVITAASNVVISRYCWVRFGVVDTLRPSLVTETNNIRRAAGHTISLVHVNRVVPNSDVIYPVPIAIESFKGPASGKFCSFGLHAEGVPGDFLSCYEASVKQDGDTLTVSSEDGVATQFDLGAGLIVDGVQVGVLLQADGQNAGTYGTISQYIPWIEQQTGLVINTQSIHEEDESLMVNFVN